MTCFRKKDGLFALTAQRLSHRVPDLHRIPLFSTLEQACVSVGSSIRVAHLPQNKPDL